MDHVVGQIRGSRDALRRALAAPMWHRPSAVVMAASIVASVLGVVLLGPTAVRITALLTVVAVASGVAMYHPTASLYGAKRAEPLAAIAAGVALLGLANGGVAGPHTSWAQLALVLTAYPPLAFGALRLFSARTPGRDADALVQAGLAALAVGVAVWVLGPHPTSVGSAGVFAAALLPALDVGLGSIVARLVLLPRERIAAYRYLLLAVGYLLVAHLIATLVRLMGFNLLGAPVTVLTATAIGFIGLAALDPSARLLAEPLAADLPPLSLAHVAFVTVAMLVGPAMVGLQANAGLRVTGATGLALVLGSLVLAAYMGSLLVNRAVNDHRVNHDDLTGLPNRVLVMDRLARAIAHARRADTMVGLVFVDLDEFKSVNDTFGHTAGDALLRLAGERLGACLRDEDTVARLGGDEFVVLLPHLDSPDGIVTVAQKLTACLVEPFEVAGQRFRVTASIGLAVYPHDGNSPQDLVAAADSAMYRVKAGGRNGYQAFAAELAARVDERLAVEAGLLAALERDELVLHYQPSIDLRTGQITGAEALVRWQHPERGLLYPVDFIPIAERSDLIVALGNWVLATACEQLVQWRSEGLPALQVAVNVSARQLRCGIAEQVAMALQLTGLDPACLALELTESAAVGDLNFVALVLAEVREMGVRWAIDDFGTGYATLTYLGRLPVDTLKIDQTFVQSEAPADRAIVAAITAMGHSLGMTMVAEGIETADQLEYLRVLGCDRAQGYLLGKPIAAAPFADLVRGVEATTALKPASNGSASRVPRLRKAAVPEWTDATGSGASHTGGRVTQPAG